MKKKIACSMLAALLLSGCSSTTNSSPPTAPDVDPVSESTSPEETPTPNPTPTETEDKSARGNLIKVIGEPAGVTSEPGGGEQLLSLVVEDIEVDVTCSAEYAQPPKNGNFVAVTLDVTTGGEPTFSENLYGPVSFDAQSWKVIGPNGTTLNTVASGPAYGCLSQEEQLPQAIGPAEKVTGKIVFDIPVTSGTLIYTLPSSNTGWEWEFPGTPEKK